MYCENGRDEEPVEEYCCALRQLVSVSLMCQYFEVRCMGGSKKAEVGGGGGGSVSCAILCSQEAAINLEARYSIDLLALQAFVLPYLSCSLFSSPEGSLLCTPSEASSRAIGRPSLSSAS